MDPSILLGAKGIEPPNPLAMAGQGATLAELLTRVQQGQLQLEQTRQQAGLWADPRMAAMLGMGGPAGAQGGAPGQPQGPSGGADSGQTQADLLRSFPLAAPGALKALTELQKTQAEIGEKRAQAGKLTQETTQIALTRLGNNAAALASQQTPVTPMQASTLIAQAKSLNTPTELLTTMPSIMDQGELKQWLAGLGAAATTPEQQANIWKVQTLTPAEVSEKTAQAGKANIEAQYVPMNAQSTRISANASATNAATESRAQQFGRASLGVNSMGQGYAVTPASAPGQAPTGAIASGAQVGVPAGVETAAKEGGMEVGELSRKAQAGAQLQAMLQEMRSQEARGIFSGGVFGTEGAKRMANLLGGLGLLPAATAEKLSHTQVFDAEAQQVIADAVSQFAGSRIAARELPFFAGTKPSTQQMASARQDLYSGLYNRAQRTIDQAQQAGQHIKTPGNTDLSNFQPQFRNVPLPPIDIGGATPDPKMNAGKVWVRDNGVKYRSNGSTWVRLD